MCVMDYFARVGAEEYQSSLYKPRDCGKKTVKRLVEKPKKRRLEDDSSVQNSSGTAKENVQPTGTDGEEPTTDKSIRCVYTDKQKQCVVQYARHHGVWPTQRNLASLRRAFSSG